MGITESGRASPRATMFGAAGVQGPSECVSLEQLDSPFYLVPFSPPPLSKPPPKMLLRLAAGLLAVASTTYAAHNITVLNNATNLAYVLSPTGTFRRDAQSRLTFPSLLPISTDTQGKSLQRHDATR